MTNNIKIARKLVLTIVFVFATASAAFAAGASYETIYNPNAPGLSANDEMSQRILDFSRREQLRLEQPENRFDNGMFDDGQKGSN
jgi:hypothetical protein